MFWLPLALAGVSSSYILFSWMWLTTDIAAIAFMTAIVALSSARRTGLVVALQALLFAAAIAMRQNMVVLGVVPAAQVVIAKLMERGKVVRGVDWFAALAFGVTAMTAVAVMFRLWGGVVPPLSADYVSDGISAAAFVHILSLTGLVAWPFLLPFTRALGARAPIVVSLALSAAFAIALASTVDLMIGQDPHLRGSIVWTIGAHLKNKILIGLFLTASIFVGMQVLVSATIVSITKGIGLFEILALGAYLGAQVPGSFPLPEVRRALRIGASFDFRRQASARALRASNDRPVLRLIPLRVRGEAVRLTTAPDGEGSRPAVNVSRGVTLGKPGGFSAASK